MTEIIVFQTKTQIKGSFSIIYYIDNLCKNFVSIHFDLMTPIFKFQHQLYKTRSIVFVGITFLNSAYKRTSTYYIGRE